MYFQSRREPGPGRARLLRVHGNSATAAHSQHPIMHMYHHHWMSGSLTQTSNEEEESLVKVHMEKAQV